VASVFLVFVQTDSVRAAKVVNGSFAVPNIANEPNPPPGGSYESYERGSERKRRPHRDPQLENLGVKRYPDAQRNDGGELGAHYH